MCNVCNTGCNGTTWNNGCGYGSGLLNTLFNNGTQYVCRDACGNLRVRTTNTCGCCQNTCRCCQNTCNCCQNTCNCCHCNNDTGTTENGNGNTDNGFYCITRCGNWQTTAQNTTQTTNGTDYNGFGRCGGRCAYNYYNG